MALTAVGRAALVAREALKTRAYRDSVGVWTIGVGHTAGAGEPIPTAGMVITTEEALVIFDRDLLKYEGAVDRGVKVPIADHERDALISICFNIGIGTANPKRGQKPGFLGSSFLKRLNAGDREGCAKGIMAWTKPAEVTTRRTAERDQFLTPYSVALPKARSNDRSAVKVSGAAASSSPTSTAPAKPKAPRMPAPVVGQWAEQRLARYEVEAIQKRLRDLDYVMVGKVDGLWGEATTAAITALQTQANLTIDGHWGPQTKAALDDDGNRRKISAARAATTAKDLRAQGSSIAIGGNRVTWSSVWQIIITVLGVAQYALQNWDGSASNLPFPLNMVIAFLPPWVAPVLVVGLNLYNALAAQGIVKARVLAERTGLHNGEPDPTPSPPVRYAPDGPGAGLGGLFGAILGRRANGQ